MIIEKLANLINVKTIITFVVIGVFAYLALGGSMPYEVAVPIITTVIGFYFGTQKQKADDVVKLDRAGVAIETLDDDYTEVDEVEEA